MATGIPCSTHRDNLRATRHGRLKAALLRRRSGGHGLAGPHFWTTLLATLLLALQAAGDDGYWAKAGGGSWATAGNWDSGTVADGTDNTAYFGLSFEPAIPTNATFTLDGARTIGNIEFTATTGPDSWALNTGSGGPLTLDATFDTPSITVGLASQTVTMSTVLAGTNGMEKQGDGTLVLTASNVYAGQTIVSAGLLRLNGSVGLDGVDVAAGTLSGTGVISGPLIVESGAILAPGNPLGALTVSNTLTLNPGSGTHVALNASTLAHGAVQGLASVVYGGSMTVTNLAGTLARGQSYSIFSAAGASGNFSSITPKPGNYLRWRFTPANGMLAVVSSASQPSITGLVLTPTNLVLQVGNGAPGATIYTLAATNAALAVSNWTRIATSSLDMSGSGLVTAPLNGAASSWFYRVAMPVAP
ncbi:MAG TPA: autotransporter-associated beta strand repeat-containing protein [Candidatus Acidoferrum sp.]|nr:autotransporter-associated beta strand repeat-containing protein [Candidatus Acidoferrum sp.]